MKMNYLTTNPLMKILHSSIIVLPAPLNISVLWNFGVLLIITLMSQIISGIFLASNYLTNNPLSFNFLILFMENSNHAWLIRLLHSNGASFYFMCIYLHLARGLYYNSFVLKSTWFTGVTILIMSMATAFIGYVLPMNQMSFWGASVITNLFSEIPLIGDNVVKILWGGSMIDSPTLSRFFAFHFLIPFIIVALVILHITFLHTSGSSNPLGSNSFLFKIYFSPYFIIKDMVFIMMFLIFYLSLVMYTPLIMGDDENFNISDPLLTPIHIQPEWYFLFAYAILRSIPNKLGGVIALMMSIIMLYSLTLTHYSLIKTNNNLPLDKCLYWLFLANVLILSWIGAQPIEPPYTIIGQLLSSTYFGYFIMKPLTFKLWDKIIN